MAVSFRRVGAAAASVVLLVAGLGAALAAVQAGAVAPLLLTDALLVLAVVFVARDRP
jgi:hypothetical protein